MRLAHGVRSTRTVLIVLLIGLATLFAQPLVARAADPTFPTLTGRVVDDARILMPETEAEISAKLARLEEQTGDQFVVVTLGSLQGYEIEDYGYRLGRHWGIGQSATDTGLLLIVAPNEHKVRLEVGYGLEPVLTDALSNQILQNDVLPAFRQGGFARGINAGVDAVITQLTLDPAEAQARVAAAVPTEAQPPVFPAIIIVILFVFFFLSLSGQARSRGRRGGRGLNPVLVWGASEVLSQIGRGSSGRSGGGFRSGGGGGGFRGGGGSFGGGGASGGW